VSAKTGIGIAELLEAIILRIPPPRGDRAAQGEGAHHRLVVGQLQGRHLDRAGVRRGAARGRPHQDDGDRQAVRRHRRRRLRADAQELPELGAGEVGTFIANIKEVADSKVGDTVAAADDDTAEALPGFQEVQPMVFAGVFPTDNADYSDLRDALTKLTLNDASVTWEPESSLALGFGFRLGFLGLLHMEIIQERLEREYDLDIITTAPSVKYHVHLKDGEVIVIDNPAKMPDVGDFESIDEPMIIARIQLPEEYLGPIIKLCQDRRGTSSTSSTRPEAGPAVYELPLARSCSASTTTSRASAAATPASTTSRASSAGRPVPRRPPGQRRARRRAQPHHAQGHRVQAGPRPVREDEG
jgi:GTP-binding protein LepA